MKSMHATNLIGLIALAAPASALAQTPAAALTRFRAVVLETAGYPAMAGNEEALVINELGETAGRVFVGDSAHAARWSADGELTVIGTTGGCMFSSARGINDQGVVVGVSVSGPPDNAFQWSPGGGTVQLPLPSKWYPEEIDATGTIAFTAILPLSQALGARWNPGWGVQRIVLPGAQVQVRGQNGAGAVTGIATSGSSVTHAFRWSAETGLVDLGAPPGFTLSQGYGINDQGVVVGLSGSASFDQATIWDGGLGPALLPFARPVSTQGAAYSINNHGWIVGSEYQVPSSYHRPYAVLWVDGVAHDLTGLLVQPPGDPYIHVSIAWDINDQGQIAARGIVGGVERALRLDPQ